MIDIEMLQKAQRYLSIRAICQDAGLSPNTIRAKLNRGTELNVMESKAIMDTLKKAGVEIVNEELKITN